MKTFETNKLFYGQYLYRLEIRNGLATFFREKNLPVARSALDTLHSQHDNGKPLQLFRGLRELHVPDIDFFDAIKLYSIFLKKDEYKLRVQANYLNIYANDISWLDNIIKQITTDRVLSLYKPNPKYKDLLTSNTIVIDHDIGYEYKVTFGTKYGEPAFAKWASANPKLIRIGDTALNEVFNSGYVNGMYFYARDEKTLQLCSLMTTNIRRIDKLIVKTNIDK